MRGKLAVAFTVAVLLWIIPARAGQTAPADYRRAPTPDHPRACGANYSTQWRAARASGSSPRVRGKLTLPTKILRACRIIPARAGQTPAASVSNSTSADHPRACGANSGTITQTADLSGSSPRVRGKLSPATRLQTCGRIIPARAGQTRRRPSRSAADSDHPRACGANLAVLAAECLHVGSSPRVRGKLEVLLNGLVIDRIIPARAGQTVRFYAKTLERWTLNNWIRTVAPIFVLLFLLPVIGQNAYIERHYSNQSFSWFSKLHYASAFDLSLVA